MLAALRLGVDRILTSGRQANAWDGRAVIASLVDASKERIVIMPGVVLYILFDEGKPCTSLLL